MINLSPEPPNILYELYAGLRPIAFFLCLLGSMKFVCFLERNCDQELVIFELLMVMQKHLVYFLLFLTFLVLARFHRLSA